mgnify:CR=1 FL=1
MKNLKKKVTTNEKEIFKIGNTFVQVEYSDTNKTLKECILNILKHE